VLTAHYASSFTVFQMKVLPLFMSRTIFKPHAPTHWTLKCVKGRLTLFVLKWQVNDFMNDKHESVKCTENMPYINQQWIKIQK